MKEDLIKEYVSSVLQEAGFVRSLSDFRGDSGGKYKKKGHGTLHRIKSFFTGHGKADALSSDWKLGVDFSMAGTLRANSAGNLRTDPIHGSRDSLADDAAGQVIDVVGQRKKR